MITKTVSRRRLLGALIVPTVALALWWYLRPQYALRQIGLDGRTLAREGSCNTTVREVFCTTARPGAPIPNAHATIQYDPLTRQLLRATRMWMLSDSVRWSTVLDSVRTVMDGSHGPRLTCSASETGFPVSERWRFGGREVRVYAGRARYQTTPSWFVLVHLVAPGASGCGPRTERVFLTPAQMEQRFLDWLSELTGS
jgi:hypothetical protein